MCQTKTRSTDVRRLDTLRIDMWCIDGLFVTGDLACTEIDLREGYPLWVRGDLQARRAVRATAATDCSGHRAETLGPLYGRVHGAATSSTELTPCMPWRHLAWADSSGSENPRSCDDHPARH